MRNLPLDPERGYPIPFFVSTLPNGEREFRAMDPEKYFVAIRQRRCWVCGETLGVWLTYVLGPMCAISRTTAEPACHLECARWSARNCPFLSKPHMRRREDGLPETIVPAPGEPIQRNPGVAAIWTTRSFQIFYPERGHLPLITVGPPEAVEWYAEGRRATRAEVMESVRTGLPLLEVLARQQEGGMQELQQRARAAEALYPAE